MRDGRNDNPGLHSTLSRSDRLAGRL